MAELTVLSKSELIALLKAGKVQEFNEKRPRCLDELSAENDGEAEGALGGNDDFGEWLDDLKKQPDRLEMGGSSCDLSGLDLTGVNFSGCDFSEASLVGANLTNANLSNCDFHLTNLEGAKLEGADVWGSDFWEANVLNVDFSTVKMLGYAKFAEIWGLGKDQQEILLEAIRSTWTDRHFPWGKKEEA